MSTESSRQLPNTLDGIEVGAVRRQKVELNSGAMVGQPRLEIGGVMELGIIDDQKYLTIWPGVAQKQSQEHLECRGVEGRDREGDEPAVCRTDGAENGDRLPCGGVIKNGIGVFRGNPHHAPRSVLMEVTFVGKQQINFLSSGQLSEFFYMRLSPPGRPGRSRLWVYADEIRVGEKASGTGGRQCRPDSRLSGDDSGVSRPRASADIPESSAPAADPGRRPGKRFPIEPTVGRAFLLLGGRRSHVLGNGESNTGRSSGCVLKERRSRKSSCRSRKEERRVADGQNGIPPTSGFRFGRRS